jgi:hypothetical protein
MVWWYDQVILVMMSWGCQEMSANKLETFMKKELERMQLSGVVSLSLVEMRAIASALACLVEDRWLTKQGF